MSSQADLNIHAAMKAVSQALKLDSGNRQMDAYIHYLKCVQYIVQILLNDAQRPVFTMNTQKCLKLGQQCFGRVEKMVDLFVSEKNVCTSVNYEPNNPMASAIPPATPTTPIVSPAADISTVHVPGSGAGAVSSAPTANVVSRPKTLTPIELAQRQNQQLMLAYKNRMAKLGTKYNTSSANMSLGLQRQMAENMAIAKARQQALAKKLEERQKRFQDEAAKRIASMGGMSKDEKERMHLYTKILEYEQDTKWPIVWRDKLKACPDDEALTLDLIRNVLNATDHPLAQLFIKYQRTIYNKVYSLVMKHIHQLVEIKVPYESSGTDNCLTGTVVKNEEIGIENGESADCRENDTPESDETNENDDNNEGKDNHTCDNETHTNDPNIAEITSDIKSDLQKAFTKGEDEITKLSKESASILKRMESFDMEAMDDLFEDSGDDDEKSDADQTSMRTASSSSSSLPYSSLTSRESVGSVDRQSNDSSIDEMEAEAIRRHLQNTILDVKESLDRLLGMFVVTYEQLGTPAGRDLCYSSLEEDFIKPLWPTILPLFRLANKQKEKNVAVVMTRLQQATPVDFKVNGKFCMEAEDTPYLLGIQELHKLIKESSPLNKLESIVKLCRLICQCVEEYYQKQEKSVPSMGADDLLPVMCYVIVKSGAPQIVSECNAMEEFIPEGVSDGRGRVLPDLITDRLGLLLADG